MQSEAKEGPVLGEWKECPVKWPVLNSLQVFVDLACGKVLWAGRGSESRCHFTPLFCFPSRPSPVQDSIWDESQHKF